VSEDRRIPVLPDARPTPLDLLVELVQREELNVFDVLIAAITGEYLERTRFETRLDLDTACKVITVASWLLLAKSNRMCPLPTAQGEAVEEGSWSDRSRWTRQILENRRFRTLGEGLEEREDLVERYFERPEETRLPLGDEEAQWEEVALVDLLRAFARFVNVLDPVTIHYDVEDYSVEDKRAEILEKLYEKKSASLSEFFHRRMNRVEVVVIFFAILELVRDSQVRILQSAYFGDIRLFFREGSRGEARD
jgi:segregation and condensation protein A